MHKRQPLKGLDFYDKRVVKSDARYKHVEGKLDTGLTVDKVKFVSATECVTRRSEIFYRISRRQLFELFDEYEMDDDDDHHVIEKDTETDDNDQQKVDVNQPHKPYLILDVRETDDYRRCHLRHARSFPYTYLRRDQQPNEIYQYRNKRDHLIIIYCDDERISRDAAKIFVDRGTDNVFLLSGGLHEFSLEYPDYIEGKLPPHLTPNKRGGLTRAALSRIAEEEVLGASETAPYLTSPSPVKFPGRHASSGRSSSRLSERSFGHHSRDGLPAAPKCRDDQSDSGYSTKSSASVAESIISRQASRKGKF